jgi:beta-lactamase class A
LDLSDLPAGQYGVWGSLGGVTVEYQPDVRMRMCSTMKLPLVGFVLEQSYLGSVQEWAEYIDLADELSWTEDDLVGHSPFTSAQTDLTATVAELCEAAARESDNTATNLLIDYAGGLEALTRYVRSIGDETTRFDRYETSMNVLDGELDTTTAFAFGRLAVAIYRSLHARTTASLLDWLPDGTDGKRIAAAAPSSLPLRHKSGTSGDGAFNDVALLLPGDDHPGSLAIFTDVPGSESDEVVAEIAHRAFQALGRS